MQGYIIQVHMTTEMRRLVKDVQTLTSRRLSSLNFLFRAQKPSFDSKWERTIGVIKKKQGGARNNSDIPVNQKK